MLDLLFALFFATTPVITSVITEPSLLCGVNDFACDDGSCVSMDLLCIDGDACPDGSDRKFCTRNQIPFGQPVIKRTKRQARCRKLEWQCRDGSCIRFDGKCDGSVDCPDGSDETFPLCRSSTCQRNWFRCAYGACVDGTALCNNQKECADGSDEQHPSCFNETSTVQGKFKCGDGVLISAVNRCDGVADCVDGSDETIRTCSAEKCPFYLFQCAYGACVDQGSDCNEIKNCADGSDESDELCNRTTTVTTVTSRPTTGACVLPPYPNHGSYVTTVSGAAPGQGFTAVSVNFTCGPGYGVVGNDKLFCYNGEWSHDVPTCVRFCTLNKDPSVEYYCVKSDDTRKETRVCEETEPTGTVVQPVCRKPNYYSKTGTLSFMRCIDGSWNYLAKCSPECGTVTPLGEQLIIDGRSAKRGELPWHAGIYTKLSTPYMQICGGSLVTTTVVISAAHCFWSSGLKPASDYAVALGKIYRPWNNSMDEPQKFDVTEIKVTKRFAGVSANFQEDIALVFLSSSVQYMTHIRPVCLDFDVNFDRRQLKEGNLGKVAGWGLTAPDGKASQVLKVVDLPYIEIEKCIDGSPPSFRQYITSDKICAGYNNGTALCKGDSGGGLVFPYNDRGTERYYLRGIVSTAPQNDFVCNANAYTSFTQVIKHDQFINEFVALNE